eukprot:TRINITY_DN3256_c0_g8_i1.p1 TRINITY_DN3256_c0_g8~~TRINITY_DN3256_c0_g8_i1.p1  ORF type:complete len:2396 (-),score=582.31 TRINITY_DN3256_c0_g8_i1:301-7338(-)
MIDNLLNFNVHVRCFSVEFLEMLETNLDLSQLDRIMKDVYNLQTVRDKMAIVLRLSSRFKDDDVSELEKEILLKFCIGNLSLSIKNLSDKFEEALSAILCECDAHQMNIFIETMSNWAKSLSVENHMFLVDVPQIKDIENAGKTTVEQHREDSSKNLTKNFFEWKHNSMIESMELFKIFGSTFYALRELEDHFTPNSFAKYATNDFVGISRYRRLGHHRHALVSLVKSSFASLSTKKKLRNAFLPLVEHFLRTQHDIFYDKASIDVEEYHTILPIWHSWLHGDEEDLSQYLWFKREARTTIIALLDCYLDGIAHIRKIEIDKDWIHKLSLEIFSLLNKTDPGIQWRAFSAFNVFRNSEGNEFPNIKTKLPLPSKFNNLKQVFGESSNVWDLIDEKSFRTLLTTLVSDVNSQLTNTNAIVESPMLKKEYLDITLPILVQILLGKMVKRAGGAVIKIKGLNANSGTKYTPGSRRNAVLSSLRVFSQNSLNVVFEYGLDIFEHILPMFDDVEDMEVICEELWNCRAMCFTLDRLRGSLYFIQGLFKYLGDYLTEEYLQIYFNILKLVGHFILQYIPNQNILSKKGSQKLARVFFEILGNLTESLRFNRISVDKISKMIVSLYSNILAIVPISTLSSYGSVAILHAISADPILYQFNSYQNAFIEHFAGLIDSLVHFSQHKKFNELFSMAVRTIDNFLTSFDDQMPYHDQFVKYLEGCQRDESYVERGLGDRNASDKETVFSFVFQPNIDQLMETLITILLDHSNVSFLRQTNSSNIRLLLTVLYRIFIFELPLQSVQHVTNSLFNLLEDFCTRLDLFNVFFKRLKSTELLFALLEQVLVANQIKISEKQIDVLFTLLPALRQIKYELNEGKYTISNKRKADCKSVSSRFLNYICNSLVFVTEHQLPELTIVTPLFFNMEGLLEQSKVFSEIIDVLRDIQMVSNNIDEKLLKDYNIIRRSSVDSNIENIFQKILQKGDDNHISVLVLGKTLISLIHIDNRYIEDEAKKALSAFFLEFAGSNYLFDEIFEMLKRMCLYSIGKIRNSGLLLFGQLITIVDNSSFEHYKVLDSQIKLSGIDETRWFEALASQRLKTKVRAVHGLSDSIAANAIDIPFSFLRSFVFPLVFSLIEEYVSILHRGGKRKENNPEARKDMNSLTDICCSFYARAVEERPYTQYLRVLRFFIVKLKRKSVTKMKMLFKRCLGVIVSILDRFHFDPLNGVDGNDMGFVLQADSESEDEDENIDDEIESEVELGDIEEEDEDEEDEEENNEEVEENDEDDEEKEEEDEEEEEKDEEKEADENSPPTELTSDKKIQEIDFKSEVIPPNTVAASLYDHALKPLSKHLVDRKRRLRLPMTKSIVRLLHELPMGVADRIVPEIIYNATLSLREVDEEVRDEGRDAIGDTLTVLGVRYLKFTVDTMSSSLDKGFRVHVFHYTVFDILKRLQEADMDYSEPHYELDTLTRFLIPIMLKNIFGSVSEEKEVDKLKVKGKEISRVRGPEGFYSLGCLVSLNPTGYEVVQYLSKRALNALNTRELNKYEDCMNRFLRGVIKSERFEDHDVLHLVRYLLHSTVDLTSQQTKNVHASIPLITRDDYNVISKRRLQTTDERDKLAPKTVFSFLEKKSSMISDRAQTFLNDAGTKLLQAFLKLRTRKELSTEENLSDLELIVSDSGKLFSQRKFNALIESLIRCFEYLTNLPLLSVMNEDILNDLFFYLTKSTKEQGNLQIATIRCIANILKKQDDEKLWRAYLKRFSEDLEGHKQPNRLNNTQLKAIINFCRVYLVDMEISSSVFTLIDLIIKRKLIDPTVYDLMEDMRRKLLVTENDFIRIHIERTLIDFYLQYPLKKGKQLEIFEFIFNNIRSSHVIENYAKCHSLLRVLDQIMVVFPPKYLEEHGIVLYLSLMSICTKLDDRCFQIYDGICLKLIDLIFSSKNNGLIKNIFELTNKWLPEKLSVDSKDILKAYTGIKAYSFLSKCSEKFPKNQTKIFISNISKFVQYITELIYKHKRNQNELLSEYQYSFVKKCPYLAISSFSKFISKYKKEEKIAVLHCILSLTNNLDTTTAIQLFIDTYMLFIENWNHLLDNSFGFVPTLLTRSIYLLNGISTIENLNNTVANNKPLFLLIRGLSKKFMENPSFNYGSPANYQNPIEEAIEQEFKSRVFLTNAFDDAENADFVTFDAEGCRPMVNACKQVANIVTKPNILPDYLEECLKLLKYFYKICAKDNHTIKSCLQISKGKLDFLDNSRLPLHNNNDVKATINEIYKLLDKTVDPTIYTEAKDEMKKRKIEYNIVREEKLLRQKEFGFDGSKKKKPRKNRESGEKTRVTSTFSEELGNSSESDISMKKDPSF